MIVTRPVTVVYLGILTISLTFIFLLLERNIYQILKAFSICYDWLFSIYFNFDSNFLDGNFELTNSNKSIFENKGITWTEWVIPNWWQQFK